MQVNMDFYNIKNLTCTSKKEEKLTKM